MTTNAYIHSPSRDILQYVRYKIIRTTVASVRSLSGYQCRVNAVGNCTDQMTSCSACYFAQAERPLPSQCSTAHKKYRCAGLTGRKKSKCLRRWGKCVRKAFKAMNQQVRGVVLKQDTVLDVCIGGTINGDLHTSDLSDVPEICSHNTKV